MTGDLPDMFGEAAAGCGGVSTLRVTRGARHCFVVMVWSLRGDRGLGFGSEREREKRGTRLRDKGDSYC